MHFVISTQELNFLLSKLQNIVGKATLPILNNVWIYAANDELVMVVTDLVVGMRCVTEAKILKEGKTTLPAKKLAQLVKELTTSHVELITGQYDVTEIVAGASRFKLHGMSEEQYPSLPDLSGGYAFTVPQAQLRDLLFRTSFAVSREENRFALTGVNLTIEGQKATFIGTDGKCLARATTRLGLVEEISGSYTLPIKAIDEITKWLTDEGEVTIFLKEDKVAFEVSGTTLVTKLLAGDYPDVTRVIPSSSTYLISLHREELMSLLRQISLFMSDTLQSVRFSFTHGELALSANSMEVGEGRVKMPVNFNGERFDIAFNPNYLYNILKHCTQESVLCGLEDAYSPCIITDQLEPPQNKEVSLYVLMPMRLSDE